MDVCISIQFELSKYQIKIYDTKLINTKLINKQNTKFKDKHLAKSQNINVK